MIVLREQVGGRSLSYDTIFLFPTFEFVNSIQYIAMRRIFSFLPLNTKVIIEYYAG